MSLELMWLDIFSSDILLFFEENKMNVKEHIKKLCIIGKYW